jgi:hypothetical protein
MNHESEPLKKFIVYVNEQSTVAYYVTAHNAQEAESYYWDDWPHKHMSGGDAEVIEVEEQYDGP